MDYLIYNSRKTTWKARKFLRAIEAAGLGCGLNIRMLTAYKPCKVLILYGFGGPDRYDVGLKHMKNGGTLLCFDIGYWDRHQTRRKYRFSINGFHPENVLAIEEKSGGRFHLSGLSIKTVKPNPDGPIMLVGNAPKSIAVGAQNWTARKSNELREAFPAKQILYRPKPKRPAERGVVYDAISEGPIDDELKKCSLVVTRHSNVAVDACRLGIPVVTDDGAAACIYPQDLNDYSKQPTEEERRQFLYKLAYWQWGANETRQFWRFFLAEFPLYDYRQLP